MNIPHPGEGWGKPGLANEWHYFRRSRSLCRAWGSAWIVNGSGGLYRTGEQIDADADFCGVCLYEQKASR